MNLEQGHIATRQGDILGHETLSAYVNDPYVIKPAVVL